MNLEQEGDTLRAEGRLAEASEVYLRLLEHDPTHVAAERLLLSITGRPVRLSSTPGGVKPAPFMVIRDFLDRSMRDVMFERLLSKAAQFAPAETAAGLQTHLRRSQLLPDCLADFDRELVQIFYARLLVYWEDHALARLRVPPFPPQLAETHGLIYRDGDFFGAHRDTGADNTRRVTFVYEMHQAPRRFSGGDLLLHDTRLDAPEDAPAAELYGPGFTRIVPEDNRLVLFPSEFYHEVTPVVGVGGDVRNGRLAINGWLHTSLADGSLARIAQCAY